MNSKHTPGPWRSTTDGRIYSESATEWNRTANCQSAAWIAATGANPANARLIAAAPDLLAALRQLVDAVTPFAVTDLESLAAARAAIAKATGGAP